MTKTICLTCLWICSFTSVGVFATEPPDEADSSRRDEVVAYFESHLASLSEAETPSLLRVAYLDSHYELCKQYFRSLPTARIDWSIINILTEGTFRGDLEYVEFVWKAFENDWPHDHFADVVVSSLSGFGFYTTAIEFVERNITDDRLRSQLLKKIAANTFLLGNNAGFQEIVTRIDDDFLALESLTEELTERREYNISIAKYVESLGISSDWGGLLSGHRNQIDPPKNIAELRERLTATTSNHEKLLLWFLWGAIAVKNRQFDIVHECVAEATKIFEHDKDKRRVWRANFLYLASASNDCETIRSAAHTCADSNECNPAVVAALITANMRGELIQYLNSITLSAEAAHICIEFLEKQSSIKFEDLLSEITNQSSRIQLLARSLDPVETKAEVAQQE